MNKYLSRITLNVNGLNVPIKMHREAECVRKHDPYICCLQKTYLRAKDLHRLKMKGWKKYSKQTREKSQGFNTYIQQNRLQDKCHKKRHRRTLHNTQGKNPSRRNKYCRHKYCKPIYTQHRSTQIYKQNLGGPKQRYRQQHNYGRGF